MEQRRRREYNGKTKIASGFSFERLLAEKTEKKTISKKREDVLVENEGERTNRIRHPLSGIGASGWITFHLKKHSGEDDFMGKMSLQSIRR